MSNTCTRKSLRKFCEIRRVISNVSVLFAYYEGASDTQYFNVIIPRLLDGIIRSSRKRPCDVGQYPALEFGIGNRSFDDLAAKICERKNEFHIISVHADLGGRGQAANIAQRREQL